jgi:uncharacterized alkaline shock family protein YloU
MKFFDKLVLKIFSLIILVLAVGLILVVTGIVPMGIIEDYLNLLINYENGIKIALGVLGVLMLFAIKGIFFTSKPENNGKDGIVLENTSGKLVISKESLENLIASVIKDIPGADTVSSKTILDRDKNLIVYVTAVVSKDVMIKDISNELQAKIKTVMKRTADLDVKEVNIKIKNITSKRVKGLPSPTEDENKEKEVEPENTNSEEKNGEE